LFAGCFRGFGGDSFFSFPLAKLQRQKQAVESRFFIIRLGSAFRRGNYYAGGNVKNPNAGFPFIAVLPARARALHKGYFKIAFFNCYHCGTLMLNFLDCDGYFSTLPPLAPLRFRWKGASYEKEFLWEEWESGE